MGVALLDSSAIVAYLYADDTLHDDAVEAIESVVRGGGSLAISAISWAELLNGANLGHRELDVLRGFVSELGISILAVDAGVAEHGAELQRAYARTGRTRDRPRLRTPDALILATAVAHPDIDIVISGDGKWSKVPGVSARVDVLGERPTP